MGNIKEINIKNRTYYFFDDMINLYCIGYITMKDSDYVKINSVKPLYLIIGEADGYIEEKMEINT